MAIREVTIAPAGEQAPGEGVRLRPIVLLSVAAFCSASSMRVADPMLPQIATEFAVTPGTASIIVTTFSLAYGLCQVLYGPLGDRLGKYLVIAVTMTVSAVSVAATAAADSLSMLALLRLVAGATSGAVIPLAMAFIGDMVPYEQRQAVLARFLSGQVLGLLFGQIAGGILLEIADWRSAFLVLSAFFALSTALLWIELRSGRVVERTRSGPTRPAQMARAYTALIVMPRPRAILLAVFLEGFLFFGAFAYAGVLLRDHFGLDYARIGLLLAGFGIGGLAYTFIARHLVRRLGERRMVWIGGALLAASFTGLATATVVATIIPIMVVVGLGFYMLHNTLQTNATQMAPEARGSAVSLFALCFFIGQAIGVGVAGFVLDRLGYVPVFCAAGIGLLGLGAWFGARVAAARAAR